MPEQIPFVLEIDNVSTTLNVVSFEGHEAVSQLFEYSVTFWADDPLELTTVVRSKATLTMWTPEGTQARTVHGIVSRIEEERNAAKHRYTLALVPWAWTLLHQVDCRIFQSLAVPDIVTKVITGAGFAASNFRSALKATYKPRDYCVQYRESNWDFVCRLLEEEGIFYYFQQTSSGEVLVLADSTSSIDFIPGDASLKYWTGTGALGSWADNWVHRFHVSQEVSAGKVTLRDWNFLQPQVGLEVKQEGKADTSLEMYDYPGEYALPADGNTYATLRLQELSARRHTGGGESTCARLAVGCKFTFTEHPTDAWNQDYFVTRLEQWGHDPIRAGAEASADRETYGNRFEVMAPTGYEDADKKVPIFAFRPPRITRRPHIHGVQTAIVVGPSGEEIYTDANGRVKVQFHWDRLGKDDDKSSCWVRVAQMWASAAFGAFFLPRINDEVVVTFEEGDPDRPLVVGSVYHGTNVPPYALPDQKTKSTIKSNSSKGGGGSNELRFEDKKGSEEIYLHGQKDWTIKIENDKNQEIGHDETLTVDHDRTKTVKHDQTGTVQHDDKLTVQNDQTLTVQHDRNVTVQNDHTETVQGAQSITVTKAQTVTLNDKQEITVAKTRSTTVTGDVTDTFQAKLTLAVTDDVSETLSAKRTIKVSGDHTESIGGKQAITVTGDSTETVSGDKSFSVTGNVTITSGSSTVTIKPSGEITIQGVKMTIDASGPLKIHGATVDIQSDGPMTAKAPQITGNADATHTIKGQMITVDGQMISLG